MTSRLKGPTQPRPLLYLRVRLQTKRCWALLDFGAADNFISQYTVAAVPLLPQPLGMPLAVSWGNGQVIYTEQNIDADIRFEGYRAPVTLKVLATQISLVLGYHFLWRHQPLINWRERTLTFRKRKYT